MSELSLRLTITAIENATKALERIAKQSDDVGKRVNKTNEYWASKDKREQEKHEHWKTNLATREAEKRIRIEERASKQKRQALLQSEQDFRTSAQRLALYTTAPTAIMATLGMRAFMEYEQQQKRLAMFFKEDMKDISTFITQYAGETAFGLNDLTAMMTTLQINRKKIGLETAEDVKGAAKDIGDTLLALVPNAEQRGQFMRQFGDIMGRGEVQGMEVKMLATYGIQLASAWERMGRTPLGDKEMYTAKDLMDILKFLRTSEEVQIGLLYNAKSFTQAWDSAGEGITSALAGLGKTLDKQFDLTGNTKIFAGVMQKIGSSLEEDEDNLTKGMASYLTMLGLTVAPMLMLIGHWRKISFLIGESNMKGSIFARRLFYASSAMSGLYLATVDWGDIMKQYEEEGFLKTTLNNLDKVIAVMMVGGALYKAIQGLYTFWIAKEARLTALAVIRAAATNPNALIAVGVAAAAVGGGYLIANALGEKSGEEISGEMGYNPLKRMLGTEDRSYADGRSIEMLANLQSQPKVEVVNNINVDKSGNVSVNTKTKDKNTYTSPYSAPVMSDFSLGY